MRTTKQLVQDLRDDADRLEREAGESCLHTDTIDNLREAAARLEELDAEEVMIGVVGWTLDVVEESRAGTILFGSRSREAIAEKALAKWKQWKDAK